MPSKPPTHALLPLFCLLACLLLAARDCALSQNLLNAARQHKNTSAGEPHVEAKLWRLIRFPWQVQAGEIADDLTHASPGMSDSIAELLCMLRGDQEELPAAAWTCA